VPDFDEAFARFAADALRGRVRRDQVGMPLLQTLQLLHERVVLGVSDLRVVENVILIFVVPQLVAQFFDFSGGMLHWSLIYNLTRNTPGAKIITTYRNTVLIHNPRAGRILRSGGALIRRAGETLRAQGHCVTEAPTTGPRTAGEIARAHIQRGADLIVVAGGDGTINEAIEGMIGSSVPLAILPAGTANVLATEMKLGRDPVKVARQLGELKARQVSVGHVTLGDGVQRHFLLMAGIGLDAHVVYNVSAALKARTGKFAYWVAGWSLLGKRLAQFEVDVDGKKHRCSFALLSKVRNYGGDFEIARSVTLMDDQFEIVLLEGKTSFEFVRYFAGMALGRLAGMRGVTVLRAHRASVGGAADARVYVQIDGEFGGLLPAELRVVPGAIRLLVPEGY
jgi:diacylglycerol kinase family enzyme